MSINLDTHKTAVAVLQDTITTIQQTHNNERVETEKTAESLKAEAEELRKHNDELTREVCNLKRALETAHTNTTNLSRSSTKDREALESQVRIQTNEITSLRSEVDGLRSQVKDRDDKHRMLIDKIRNLPCLNCICSLGFMTEAEKVAECTRRVKALFNKK